MRKFVFADESGCLTFTRKQNVSRYFIICTVTLDSCDIGQHLLDLRRQLAWQEYPLNEYFHATEDRQVVRDAVFDLLRAQHFRIDATILEKSKARPHVRNSSDSFYRYAWFYHFKHIAPRIVKSDDELLVSIASIGPRKKQAIFRSSVNDVVQQSLRDVEWKTDFCPAAADPCLQIADYCAWALKKKWENNDLRSYNLISDKIHSEFDLWQTGTTHYY